jgi:hypothetical protein
MDIGLAIKYVMDDEDWIKKIGIGALLALFMWLIVPALILTGYSVKVARNVMAGEARPLPEWEDWGALLMDGLNVAIAMFVYSLPIMLLSCCMVVATMAMGGMSEFSSDAAGAGIALTTILFTCLVFIYAIALMFLAPAVVVQYVRTDTLGSTLQFGTVVGIVRDNIGDVVMVLVVSFAINFVISMLAVIPFIGFLIALAGYAYVMAVMGHMYGQIGLKIDGGGASKEEKFDAF